MKDEDEITGRHFQSILRHHERTIEAHHKKAAMIGYYRQGATIKEIAAIMGILEETIDKVIYNYLKKK